MCTLTEKDAERIAGEYFAKFGVIPQPAIIHHLDVAEVLREYLEAGEPVPDDYDWYADLPPGAVAGPGEVEVTCPPMPDQEDMPRP